ncbi:hypothetical protein ACQPW3_12180 [Actinosynnema sp. CA-248983]
MRARLRAATLLAALLSSTLIAPPLHAAGTVTFLGPTSSTLTGTVDLEVSAPADATAVLISYGKTLDPTRLYTEVSAWRTADKSYGHQDVVLANGWYGSKFADVPGHPDDLRRDFATDTAKVAALVVT